MTISPKHPRVRELSFQQLLNQHINELDLRPSDILRECLIQLRRELKKNHIAYFPHIYFGDEPWGCIDRTGSIEIPFYVANKALHRVARKYYISYSKDEMMMLLRHEVGHALNYAHKLWQRRDWKGMFGTFRQRYRNFYSYDPYSKHFVRYLHYIGNPHYAQKHPDEDFAETFAVWLDPSSKWKWHYRSWNGALEKLEYTDMGKAGAGSTPPATYPGGTVGNAGNVALPAVTMNPLDASGYLPLERSDLQLSLRRPLETTGSNKGRVERSRRRAGCAGLSIRTRWVCPCGLA
jgi:hypothetical protein